VRKSNYQAAIKALLGGERGTFIFQVYIIVVLGARIPRRKIRLFAELGGEHRLAEQAVCGLRG